MKRRKLILFWTALHAGISLLAFITLLIVQTDTAIVPPPWSDPVKNPCAALPGGWQLLYWPPLKKCFKIFTIGYPCPETMELSPAAPHGKMKGNNLTSPAAECRCPPGTALSAETNKCHTIFERGPCALGQYFKPAQEVQKRNSKNSDNNRWGTCRTPRACPDGMLFWAIDGKCYTKYTKGPCIKGKLLVLNESGLAECRCHDDGELSAYYYEAEETCHEHYTKGPCSTPGQLFLPGGRCDCHNNLPHFHEPQQMCFELNSPGPCPPGHIYNIPENVTLGNDSFARARCQCKDGYVLWTDGICYRLYTRGPCGPNEFIISANNCMKNICGKSRLYFPDQKSCYRIGSQGPCSMHQVVVFDFTARPSIDGISYNGMCGCSGIIKNMDQQCDNAEHEPEANTCESTPGMVEINSNCYKLYSRGPCGPGQWLAPLKTQLVVAKQRLTAHKAKCVCRPGYTNNGEVDIFGMNVGDGGMVRRCNAPSVGLARYLTTQRQNHRYSSSHASSSTTDLINFPYFQLLTS